MISPLLSAPHAASRTAARYLASYQDSRFGRVTRDLPAVLSAAQLATREYTGGDKSRALGLLALTYQAAAMTLTKVGETDLAWTASDRGLAAAESSGDPVVLGSLFRSVAHSLLSTGQYAAAVRLTEQAADYLRNELAFRSPGTDPELVRLQRGEVAATRIRSAELPSWRQMQIRQTFLRSVLIRLLPMLDVNLSKAGPVVCCRAEISAVSLSLASCRIRSARHWHLSNLLLTRQR